MLIFLYMCAVFVVCCFLFLADGWIWIDGLIDGLIIQALLNEMPALDLMANEFCYTAAITGCGIGGQWEQAVATFRLLAQQQKKVEKLELTNVTERFHALCGYSYIRSSMGGCAVIFWYINPFMCTVLLSFCPRRILR